MGFEPILPPWQGDVLPLYDNHFKTGEHIFQSYFKCGENLPHIPVLFSKNSD